MEPDSLPLHIVGQEPETTERQVAQFVVDKPELQKEYAGWIAALHSEIWKEVENMARIGGKKVLFDIRPAVESLGLKRVIDQVGLGRVIEAVGADRVMEEIGEREVRCWLNVERYVAGLSPAERQELKRRLQQN